jgi:hypothetical protein
MATADRLETYATSYFTGSQASIWIGDVWVDEVFGISFSASQSILPIFGYASSFFDAVARGKVLVQGYFEINFIDEGYLYSILNDRAKLLVGDKANQNPDMIKYARENHMTIQQMGEKTARTQQDVILDQIQLLKEVGNGAFPDGRSRRQTMSQIMNELSQLDSISLSDIASEINRRSQPVNTQNRSIIYEMIPFTLKGHFGNPELGGEDRGTVKEIRDCFLIGNEMVVDSSEDVVKERYSFLARLHV